LGLARPGRTASPEAFTVRPTARMVFAAVLSRSCRTPQAGHVHWRTSSGRESRIGPHT